VHKSFGGLTAPDPVGMSPMLDMFIVSC